MYLPTGRTRRLGLLVLVVGLIAALLPSLTPRVAARPRIGAAVVVPPEDRFTPFAVTIRAGQTVQWTNKDTDDHTVVTDRAFTTAGHEGVNQLLPGTDSNNGRPGTFMLTFDHPGVFVYYCRFHAHLDAAGQPVAPGPRGGIQDSNGNFGTPMMGVITVLSGRDD
jgi:plastocyanin